MTEIKQDNFLDLKAALEKEIKKVHDHPKVQELIEKYKIENWRKHFILFKDYLDKGECPGCKVDSTNPEDHLYRMITIEEAPSGRLIRVYKKCDFFMGIETKNKFKANYLIRDIPVELLDMKLDDVINDDNRSSIVKYMQEFLKGNDKIDKGLYIYGALGIGKSYLMTSFANELARQGKKVAYIMVPELQRMIKASFSDRDINTELITKKLMTSDVLFLDDIGGETVAPWFRDEQLLKILDSRMRAKKWTFFTSNYNMHNLINVLSESNNRNNYSFDRAKRLVERIKSLCHEVQLVGEYRRT